MIREGSDNDPERAIVPRLYALLKDGYLILDSMNTRILSYLHTNLNTYHCKSDIYSMGKSKGFLCNRERT